MRIRTALLLAAVTLIGAPGADAAGPARDPRVRPLDEGAASLVAEAQEKSPTVRSLFKQLEGADVVAYVQTVRSVEGLPLSGLQFLGASTVERYVLIQIANCDVPCRRIELLGHELRHVAEVAGAQWVRSDDSMQRMIQKVGWRDTEAARGYETRSATLAEKQVRSEVRATGTPN